MAALPGFTALLAARIAHACFPGSPIHDQPLHDSVMKQLTEAGPRSHYAAGWVEQSDHSPVAAQVAGRLPVQSNRVRSSGEGQARRVD